MVKIQKVLLTLALALCAPSAFAACHVVTPAGSGTKSGADWNNAYAKLPTNLTRGDVYYLSDGTYGAYSFGTAASGTATVEVRKAQASDHCIDVGWVASTFGAAQAVFTDFSVVTSYLTLNGNGSYAAQGCGGGPGATVTAPPLNPSDCGIKIDNSACSGGANACNSPVGLGNFSNSASNTGTTFKYIELKGNGNDDSERMLIWAPFNRGVANTGGSFTHIYGHNAGCVYFQNGADGRSVTYSYFWGTEVNGAQGSDPCHGQYSYYDLTDSNGTEAHNVYRDITGTSVHTFGTSGTHSGWKFYDNVYVDSNASGALGNLSDGIVACINTSSNCNNFTFSQNSIIQIHGNTGINNENTGSYTVQNNIWYSLGGPPNFSTGSNGRFTQDHNSFLNIGGSCPSGTANVCATGSPNPFVNWPANNFKLASEHANWNSRLTLAAPYDMDASGAAFTSDRGAYQFAGIIVPPVPPPATSMALPVATPTSVTLSWNGVSTATSYNVKRKTSAAGTYSALATTAVTNYVDTSVMQGSSYWYVVTAVNSAGESDPSNEVSTTIPLPPPPTVTVTVAPATSSVQVGGTQQFTVTVTNSSNTAVTWTDTCGTIDANGLYLAPATVGNCVVTATSQADTSKTGTAQVAVTAAPPPPGSVISFWPTTATPANQTTTDTLSVELGTKMTSSVAGSIVGIRWWKPIDSTVVHTCTLWSATGVKVSSGTFTNETPSGWQTCTLPAPIAILASQAFTVSIHTTKYAFDMNYFTAAKSAPPLSTPVNAGVYAYGSTSAYPTKTWNASNYWVDVLMQPASTTPPPVSITIAPTTTSVQIAKAVQFTATVSNATNTAVTWSATPACGTVNASGLFTATAVVAPCSVTATSAADTTKAAVATVTVTPPPPALSWSCAGLVCTVVPVNMPRGTIINLDANGGGADAKTTVSVP